MRGRSVAIVTGVYVTVAATAVATMAFALASPSGNLDPGSAQVPQQGVMPPGGVAGPQEKPLVKEKAGPSQLSCQRWPNGVWTQTVDPSSPACRAAWDTSTGNGGSTSPGVNGSVITIGMPKVTPDVERLVAWFNSQYQLYGRTVKVVGIGSVGTPAQTRAAIAAAKEAGVFAVLDADPEVATASSDVGLFLSQSAAQKIVAITPQAVPRADLLTTQGPYPWSVATPQDISARRTAEMVCKTLKGRPLPNSATARSFAVVSPVGLAKRSASVSPDVVIQALKKCGIDAVTYEYRGGSAAAADAELDSAAVASLKGAGTTSVIALGDPVSSESLLSKASASNYTPEWIFSGLTWSAAQALSQASAQQTSRVLVTLDGAPLTLGYQEVALRVASLAGIAPERMEAFQGVASVYSSLATLFAGLQGAGPDLTAASFAFGMETNQYPNVNSGQPPAFQPRVGYALGDHYGERDTALGWWDGAYTTSVATAAGAMPVRGRLCLMQQGRRFDAENPFPSQPDGLYRECHRS